MQVKVDFSKNIGKVKAVNGVTNGPVCKGTDLSEFFKDLNISSVRYHDTDGSGPYGRRAIDISRIFPYFDADENDENNYRFAHTDEIITAAKNCGADVIYRLGESIDHSVKNYDSRPPKDFDKWCRICVNVIRHYNDGWANGFHYDIKYWEIWNEPEGAKEGLENRKMWCGGTLEDVFLLYKKISTAIKAYNPELKVGGLSFMYCDYAVEPFMKYCRKENLPLDFISFHHYANDLEWIVEQSNTIESLKKQYGYPAAEVIIAEWTLLYLDDYNGIFWDFIHDDVHNGAKCKELTDNQKYEKGASFITGFMIRLNDLPITKSALYDFAPKGFWCCLFDFFYNPTKAYFALKNYGTLLKNSEYRAFARAEKGHVIASKGNGYGDCLMSNFLGDPEVANFECDGVSDFKELKVYAIDEKNTNEVIYAADVKTDKITFDIPVGKYTSLYLSFR